jgi:hypothetical protein
LHTGLEEILGPGRAATLMSRLPAVPWPDVVTKSYLDKKLTVVEDKLTLARVLVNLSGPI